MWFWLALLPGLLQAPTRVSEAPIESVRTDAGSRQKLRALTGEFARAGEAALVARMQVVLKAMGEGSEGLQRAARGWEKALASVRPGRSSQAALAARLRRELVSLVEALARTTGSEKQALARVLLELDAHEPKANEALGYRPTLDGEWLTAEEWGWRQGAEDTENHLHAAEVYPVEVEGGASTNPLLLELCGTGQVVRSHGVELHGRLSAETLERILGRGLRAAALSRGILFDQVDLPASFERRTFVLLDSHALFLCALEEARASGGLAEDEFQKTRSLGMLSFNDKRGWRVSEATGEADMQAVLLWSLLPEWLGYDAQPCLRVGHLNWVCLRFLGTAMPLIVWSEQLTEDHARERSATRSADPRSLQTLWRIARRSLWGTRSWMVAEAREGRDPPWARTMLDQDGKIRDASLLKTTLVCELLQDEGRLWEVVQATRAKTPPAPAFEKILGEELPAFEERWRRWLDPPQRAGILQELEHDEPEAGQSPFDAALLALNHARADTLGGQHPEIQIVTLDPDLCRAAERHARYLTLNPEQKKSWPEIHEEYGGAPGFTPEGALAGGNSLVALCADPLAAVRGWLGTFYHRLPLLDPGLFGVGFGLSKDVVVLDVTSLRMAPYRDHVMVWPLPEADDVPLGFTPELPNPVPQADMARLGYPVTVQLTFADGHGFTDLTLELFFGAIERGEPVDCYFVTPSAPLQPALVPPNAWGLIPKAPLARHTRYTARARWGDTERVWSFRTVE